MDSLFTTYRKSVEDFIDTMKAETDRFLGEDLVFDEEDDFVVVEVDNDFDEDEIERELQELIDEAGDVDEGDDEDEILREIEAGYLDAMIEEANALYVRFQALK